MAANGAKPEYRAWSQVFRQYPHLQSGALDHGEGFATPDGFVIIASTYVQMGARGIAKLQADCDSLGIEVRVFVGAGWRAIPSTRIEYRRKNSRDHS